MGTVTLTTEEYADLLRAASKSSAPVAAPPSSRRKRKGRTAAGMAKALRAANKKARKKNGEFRKGYDQKRVMQMAHKIRRQMNA